jgi:DNA repair protein RadC
VVALCDETCNANLHKTSRIGDPDKVVRFLRQAIGRKQQEWFAVILLDARQRVIDILGVSIGTLASVDVHPREVFREAVRRAAHSILIAHNHPSGDAEPSDSDVHLTHRMSEVGKLVGIPVLDHLILTPTGSVSLAAMGLVPNPGPKRHPTRRKAKKPVSRSTFSRLMRI